MKPNALTCPSSGRRRRPAQSQRLTVRWSLLQVLLELLQVGSVVQFNEERLLTLAEQAKL